MIPAWNEQQCLPRLLDSVQSARAQYGGGADAIEVIVADNASTDATARIARERGCRVAPVSKRCIAASRNAGARLATGRILAFADADFRIHPQTFRVIADLMGRRGIIGGGTGVTLERWSAGIELTWMMIVPPMWLIGFDGGVWFCRRSDFQEVGGFDESVRAGEDVLFLTALWRLGRSRRPPEKLATRFTARRLGMRPAIAVASCRKFDRYGDWYLILETLRGLLWMVFSRRRLERLIERQWYRDDLRGSPPTQ